MALQMVFSRVHQVDIMVIIIYISFSYLDKSSDVRYFLPLALVGGGHCSELHYLMILF